MEAPPVIRIYTGTVMSPGAHTLGAVLRGDDGADRIAKAGRTCPDAAEGLYGASPTPPAAPWNDFPARHLTAVDGVSGDLVITDLATGTVYARVRRAAPPFSGAGLKPAGWMNGVLTVLDTGQAQTCWNIDFIRGKVIRITGDPAAPATADLAAAVVKEAR